jgi:hypothetical protein
LSYCISVSEEINYNFANVLESEIISILCDDKPFRKSKQTREVFNMANTTYLKQEVERFVRDKLYHEYGVDFSSHMLTLPTGGTHEFDAVSSDKKIVAAIKTASGKTSGGKNPSAKIRDIEAELYYFMLVQAARKILVLTNPSFFDIVTKRLKGRLHPDIEIKLVELSEEIKAKVDAVQKTASDEMRKRYDL